MAQVPLLARTDNSPYVSGTCEPCGTATPVQVANALGAGGSALLTVLRNAEGSWRELDLTSSQTRGLIVLAARGELTVSGLATLLAMGRPSGSLLVDQLVQRGLVTRTDDPTDRRCALVRLDAPGYALLARLFAADEQPVLP